MCAVTRRRPSVGASPTQQGVAPAGSNRSGSVGEENRAIAHNAGDCTFILNTICSRFSVFKQKNRWELRPDPPVPREIL
jgi:hypothetical protein